MSAINHAEVVSQMVRSPATKSLLQAYGLDVHTVTWEDTGRDKGSAFGPNISDMTLIVRDTHSLMPVIRKPNFSDVTCDVPVDAFKLRKGDQITNLQTILKDLNLWLERDSAILSSAQCCVLPCGASGNVDFAVQLFNYQSVYEDPAVLVIVATKDGTSMRTLDSSKVKLFFNDNDVARWFNAERLETVRIREKAEKTRVDSFREMTAEEKLNNSIMVIQVPLKQKKRPQSRGFYFGGGGGGDGCAPPAAMAACASSNEKYADVEESSSGFTLFSDNSPRTGLAAPKPAGMDMAQLRLGSSEGIYPTLNTSELVRDDRFPIRCTFQYYRVTDQGSLTERDIVDIKEQLDQMLSVAQASGSLVMSDSTRLTEPTLQANDQKSTNLWAGQQMGNF